MKVFKYELRIQDSQVLRLPNMAQILCVQVQEGQPQLWALVDEKAPLIHRHILCVGTGHNVPDVPKHYLGTIQLHKPNGVAVFHFFEISQHYTLDAVDITNTIRIS